MVHHCCAFNCKEKFVKGGPVTFHSFPKDESRRKLWEMKTKRKDFKASDNTKICSKHFTPESFEVNKFGGTWLKKEAVPSIFDFPPHLIQKDFKRKPRAQLKSKEELDSEAGSSKKFFSEEHNLKRHPAVCHYTETVRSSKKPRILLEKENTNVFEGCGIINNKPMRFRHLVDFTEDDMDSPRKAKKMFRIATAKQLTAKTKIKCLRKENKNLERRVAALQEMLRKKRVSEAASDVLELSITSPITSELVKK